MSNGEGGGGRWVGIVGFIAVIVLLNVLSHVFGWGYTFY